MLITLVVTYFSTSVSSIQTANHEQLGHILAVGGKGKVYVSRNGRIRETLNAEKTLTRLLVVSDSDSITADDSAFVFYSLNGRIYSYPSNPNFVATEPEVFKPLRPQGGKTSLAKFEFIGFGGLRTATYHYSPTIPLRLAWTAPRQNKLKKIRFSCTDLGIDEYVAEGKISRELRRYQPASLYFYGSLTLDSHIKRIATSTLPDKRKVLSCILYFTNLKPVELQVRVRHDEDSKELEKAARQWAFSSGKAKEERWINLYLALADSRSKLNEVSLTINEFFKKPLNIQGRTTVGNLGSDSLKANMVTDESVVYVSCVKGQFDLTKNKNVQFSYGVFKSDKPEAIQWANNTPGKFYWSNSIVTIHCTFRNKTIVKTFALDPARKRHDFKFYEYEFK
jgi:hypothetical protein